MAGPWEKYAASAKTEAPWTKYGQQAAAPKREFYWDYENTGNVLEATPSTPRELIIPGYGELGDNSGRETEAQINARVKHRYSNRSALKTLQDDLTAAKRSSTPLVRGGIKAITAIPGLAADAGVGLRNVATGSNYELPTRSMERSLDQYLPLPGTPGDKTLEFMTSVLGGAKVPVAPSVKNPAPANFVKPGQDLVRQETLRRGRDLGLVVPPSTTNPNKLTTALESLGGKTGTAQDAAIRNQDKFNSVAKSVLGLSDDAPLTQEALQALRREAGDAYENLRGAGQIVADAKYADDLAAITAKYRGAAKDFPELAKSEVDDLIAGVTKKEFSSDSAVDLLSILRDKTNAAFRAGDSGLGRATKDVSKAIEELIQRRMSEAGRTDLVQKFKEARELIAKSWSVEEAMNPATGNVVGNKLASQLSSGEPLTGNLREAARFAQAFPKASNAVSDSGAVRNTDVILGAGAAGVSSQPQWLLYPFLRQGARSFLLSEPGQKLAVPGSGVSLSPEQVLRALLAAEQARKSAE
jgi:hypothetical protein